MIAMQMNVKGEGRPLVLVGGGLTGWRSWEPFQARLSSTRRVARAQPISVQYGLENAQLPEGYSIELESAALGEAIARHGFEGPVDVVAWSYGALITLDYALDHPERIRTLTLIEPPALWVLDATNRWTEVSSKESAAMRELYATMKGDVTEAQLGTFVRAAGLVPPGMEPHQLPSWPSWVEHRRSLRTEDAAWAHIDSADRLRRFDRPVMLVKGVGTASFLADITDALAATLPNATVVELPGGHAPHIVSTEDFLEELSRFQE